MRMGITKPLTHSEVQNAQAPYAISFETTRTGKSTAYLVHESGHRQRLPLAHAEAMVRSGYKVSQ